MRPLIVLSCLVAVALAKPGYLGIPVAYNAIGISHLYAAPATVTSQYHAQDELGQYSYGYQGDTSAKQEVRTLDGVTRGAYSYLDANGIVQSASYVSDPVHGFRVAATNLPVDSNTPVVHAVAPTVVSHTPDVVVAKTAILGRKKRSATHVVVPHSTLLTSPEVVAYSAPATVVTSPVKSYSYSAVATHTPSHVVSAYAAPSPVKSYSYSTVSEHVSPVVAAAPAVVADATPLVSTYSVPAAVVPVKAHSYSPVVASAPAVVSTYSAPTAVVTPVKTTSYHTLTAHSTPVVASVVAEGTPVVSTYSATPVVSTYSATPVVSAYAATPVVAEKAVPVVPAVVSATSSQYHAQDEIGQYSYGYADGNSAKHEARAADGTTVGRYSYVDSNGLLQSVNYQADGLGFRVAGTNVPVA